ncbi:MAG: trehalose-6-phosphate synthase [Tepidiformaceae bacterium]
MATAALILANRSYLDHEAPRGAPEPSSAANGGLLAAVRPAIAPWDGVNGTTWIGAGRGPFDREWVDAAGFELIPSVRGPVCHRRLFFDDAAWAGHYGAVANCFLWPLLHLVRAPLPERTGYYPVPAIPTPEEWAQYVFVNQQFADAGAAQSQPTAWIHDYQLALAPEMLRKAGFPGRIGYFLHTPFFNLRVASRYLHGEGERYLTEVVSGMLGAHLVGFQSNSDAERFRAAAVQLCGAEVEESALRFAGRKVAIGTYPVGVEVDEILAIAKDARTPPGLAAVVESGLPLVVGLERADFTKGIPERLRAVAAAYRNGARFAYVGVAAPTRAGVKAYSALAGAIEAASLDAQAAATAAGLPFVQSQAVIPWAEVIGLQRRADVVFTSSLADGLNLVPIQAAIAQSTKPLSERAVIITGRDAGVAHAFSGFESDGLVPVDPLDSAAMTATLLHALRGQPGRVSDRLVAAICEHDALAWATRFLTDLERTC